MKKLFKIISLAALAALLMATAAFAQGTPNIKGDVIGFDEGDGFITVETQKGDTYLVYTPSDFDFSSLELGDSVIVRGEVQDDGTVLADSVKLVGGGSGAANGGDGDEGEGGDEGGEGGEGEGSKGTKSAFCSDKKEDPHPFAASIAETYGVSAEEINAYTCEGYSLGEIMLALQTNRLGGGDVAGMLGDRKAGKGWGQIWADGELIGSPEAGSAPPGLLNRPEHAGGPPEGKGPDADNPNNDNTSE